MGQQHRLVAGRAVRRHEGLHPGHDPDTTRTRLFVLEVGTGDSLPVDRRRGGPGSMTWSGPT